MLALHACANDIEIFKLGVIFPSLYLISPIELGHPRNIRSVSAEATRFASGRKNGMAIEVNGEKASLRCEFESMNELWVHDHTVDGKDAGFRRGMVTESDHPYVEGWWPPGHVLGYDHTFTHEFRDFVLDIVNDRAPEPSFADGLYVQRVLDAVERSAQAQSVRTNV